MCSAQRLLYRSLVGLAIIFSANIGAAGLSCVATGEGFRCEAWPQGSSYRYEWHVAGDGKKLTPTKLDAAVHTVRCQANRANPVAVSVIAPAGYIETATQLLPACGNGELESSGLDATVAVRSP